MKYLTAVFYTEKTGKTKADKVIYFKNPASDACVASSFSKTKVSHVINAKPKAEDVHARTFEIGVSSYDLR